MTSWIFQPWEQLPAPSDVFEETETLVLSLRADATPFRARVASGLVWLRPWEEAGAEWNFVLNQSPGWGLRGRSLKHWIFDRTREGRAARLFVLPQIASYPSSCLILVNTNGMGLWCKEADELAWGLPFQFKPFWRGEEFSDVPSSRLYPVILNEWGADDSDLRATANYGFSPFQKRAHFLAPKGNLIKAESLLHALLWALWGKTGAQHRLKISLPASGVTSAIDTNGLISCDDGDEWRALPHPVRIWISNVFASLQVRALTVADELPTVLKAVVERKHAIEFWVAADKPDKSQQAQSRARVLAWALAHLDPATAQEFIIWLDDLFHW